MILFIDTSDYDLASLALISDKVISRRFASRNLSEVLLREIEKFCKKQKTTLRQIKKIAVVTGPGGFSRIRTAVATANALAFGLKIPVIALSKLKIPEDLSQLKLLPAQKMAEPIYDKQPNITMSKKR